MSWEREPLLTKAKLFFERGLEQDREDPLFPFWCSLGLELLARAAVASVSPFLLAAQDPQQRNILHVLGRTPAKYQAQSLGAKELFKLCSALHPSFTENHVTNCLALANRRNEELHTGAAPFSDYPTRLWLLGFYQSVKALADALQVTLDDILGEEHATAASEMLREATAEARSRVHKSIAAHRQIFEERDQTEKEQRRTEAANEARILSWRGHHTVKCPSCGSDGTSAGIPVGEARESLEGEDLVVRQQVLPTQFSCKACELQLTGYAELEIAGIGGQHTRTSRFDPAEYYASDDVDNAQPDQEYDNE